MKKIKIKREIRVFAQIDFELAEFDDSHNPKEFFRFAHSSDLSDAQAGFKGYNHKIILRAVSGSASERDDVIVITPKSTPQKYTIQKTKGKPIVPRFLKFSVDKGIRFAYEQVFDENNKPFKIDNKLVYKEIPSKTSSYEQSLETIYFLLFGDKAKDIKKMWSFVGVVELMKKLSSKQIDETFKRVLALQWGPGAQAIERDDKMIDLKVKASGVNYMIKKLKLQKFQKEVDKMIEDYYAKYNSKKLSESEKTFRKFIKV